MGGTSMAAPLVTGCAALVREYFQTVRNHAPSAALVKATLISSTTWLTGQDAVAPKNGFPNYHQGHGRINMQCAVPNPTMPSLRLQFNDQWQPPGVGFTATGQRRRYQFSIPAGVPWLRITMAYTDLPARGLQNNLNLFVQHLPSKNKWMGNPGLPDSMNIPDPDNNVESVRIENPEAGDYLIQISVTNLLKGPQDFALVVTGDGVSPLIPV
jgi:serine protease AprX